MSHVCSGILSRQLKGANEKEIMEAIEVGIEMGGGPATAHARFALEVLETLDFSKNEIKKHP